MSSSPIAFTTRHASFARLPWCSLPADSVSVARRWRPDLIPFFFVAPAPLAAACSNAESRSDHETTDAG